MARIKYYYDTEKCKYVRVRVKTSDVILSALGFISMTFIAAVIVLTVLSKYFPTPKEAFLQKDNVQLEENFEIMRSRVKDMEQMLEVLIDRDKNIYRAVTGADSLPSALRNAGIGGSVKYFDLLDNDLDGSKIIAQSLADVEHLKRRLYVQTKSYDEIIALAKRKEEMLASIPAIQPVSNNELKRLASGFGMRIHPIYKVKKMHTGVDFSAPIGTPIYATGDGVIKIAQKGFSGYGNQVEVDHGFGYVTKYAHMKKFIVKPGQKVKRGELIGYLGNSGTSTAPHLHYEVIKNGEKVNPVHYFFNDLDPAQYEQILKLSSIENQSLS